jgi:RNA polymerase-binding protein DksA
MESDEERKGRHRLDALRDILTHQRNVLLARIRELRRSQEEEKVTEPSDDMDVARSQADVETHASLIEHSEDLLKAIDTAASRLDEGRYGICEGCGTDIPIKRLDALPFAIYCVECQKESETGRERGTISESFMRHWEVPEEMNGSLERQDNLADPEEQLTIHSGSMFGPEEAEPVEPSSPPGARGQHRRQS